jgi:hypothetical protein
VARTLDPNRELDDFKDRLESILTRHETIYTLVPSSEKKLRKTLAVDAAFRIGTEWELFQHRWHIAAISKAPEKFVATVQSDLDRDIAKVKDRLEAIQAGSTTVPKKLNATQISKLVDPAGYNLTFADTQAWMEKAGAHLTDRFKSLVVAIGTSAEDTCVLDLVRAVRNYVAHGSDSSRERLNQYIKTRPPKGDIGITGSKNKALARDIRGISEIDAYLHSKVGSPAHQRVVVIGKRVLTIAEKLRY